MPAEAKIRVLIVDDSALMRRTLRNLLEDAGFEVAGIARDGQDGVVKARELRPDVVTMDINMPTMDGLTALHQIISEEIAPVVMVSSLTHKGAVATFEALELGAFDYVGKPDGTVSAEMGSVRDDLVAKLQAASRRGTLGRLARLTRRKRDAMVAEAPRLSTAGRSSPDAVGGKFGYRAVVMGISTGGPATIMEVLPLLPRDLPAALFLVQHMPPKFIPSYVERIAKSCAIDVEEAEFGREVRPGCCYVAKGGYQLGVLERSTAGVMLRTPSFPETLFIPSVGVAMESVLKVYGADTIGVLMTGIGDDGADGMVKIRQAGGCTIAESEETAVVFGMPREAIERGGADVVAPSYQIAQEIVRAVYRPRRTASTGQRGAPSHPGRLRDE